MNKLLNLLVFKIYIKISSKFNKFKKRQESLQHYKYISESGGFIGSDVKFGNNVVISGHKKISIGRNVHFGSDTFIRAEGGLEIGDNVVFSRNITLYTTSHNHKGVLLPYDNTNIAKPVIIEDNVWIGMNVTISPGTVIREGAIIGLGSRIYGEIPKGAIVGSANPKIISYRDKSHYNKLIENQKFCKENGYEYIK
jgi:acetyltransferase-like isoleucine patch superfamily enzyme